MITQSIIDSLCRDMSYQAAVDCIGSQGEIISEVESTRIPGHGAPSFTPVRAVILEWINPDDSVLRLLFRNNRLIEISSIGFENS